MYRIIIVATCLACASHGQRRDRTGERFLRGRQSSDRQHSFRSGNVLQQLAQLLLGFQNPTFLTFRKSGLVTVGLGPEVKPTEVQVEPTWDGEYELPVYGVVSVGLPMGMVFEESQDFEGRYEIFQVKPKTNAATAGLRSGDFIRSVSKFDTDSHHSLFCVDGQEFDDVMSAIKSNADHGHALLVIERNIAPKGALGVCTTGMNCKRAKAFNSMDQLELLRWIATTHKGIALANEERLADTPAAELQEEFAKSLIAQSRCFETCGGGVSVYNDMIEEVEKDINTAPQAMLVLKSLGLDIPPLAGIAYLRRMNAKKKILEGNLDEALTLLSDAIKAAASLKAGGASLTRLLYGARADLHEEMGNADEAQADRATAESLMEMRYPTLA